MGWGDESVVRPPRDPLLDDLSKSQNVKGFQMPAPKPVEKMEQVPSFSIRVMDIRKELPVGPIQQSSLLDQFQRIAQAGAETRREIAKSYMETPRTQTQNQTAKKLGISLNLSALESAFALEDRGDAGGAAPSATTRTESDPPVAKAEALDNSDTKAAAAPAATNRTVSEAPIAKGRRKAKAKPAKRRIIGSSLLTDKGKGKASHRISARAAIAPSAAPAATPPSAVRSPATPPTAPERRPSVQRSPAPQRPPAAPQRPPAGPAQATSEKAAARPAGAGAQGRRRGLDVSILTHEQLGQLLAVCAATCWLPTARRPSRPCACVCRTTLHRVRPEMGAFAAYTALTLAALTPPA